MIRSSCQLLAKQQPWRFAAAKSCFRVRLPVWIPATARQPRIRVPSGLFSQLHVSSAKRSSSSSSSSSNNNNSWSTEDASSRDNAAHNKSSSQLLLDINNNSLDPWNSLGLLSPSAGFWTVAAPSRQSDEDSLLQLPEVRETLENYYQSCTAPTAVVDTLQRSAQIFANNIMPTEYQTLLVLLVETQVAAAAGLADYQHAGSTLDELEAVILKRRQQQQQTAAAAASSRSNNVTPLSSSSSSSSSLLLLQLARAKLSWLQGDFESTLQLCDKLLLHNNNNIHNHHHHHHHHALITASARTGQAVARLLQATTLDDIFSVRDPFRMTVKLLEAQRTQISTSSTSITTTTTIALAAAHLNLGIAEAVYAHILAQERPETEVPLDAALRNWNHALTLLKQRQRRRSSSSSSSSSIKSQGGGALITSRLLQARLQANMAWGLLQMPRERDHVKRASEFAAESLQTLDALVSDSNNSHGSNCKMATQAALGRTLGLIADCYHKSGAAVTAEGLFQSALDDTHAAKSPLDKLIRREVLTGYGGLCNDWENREADGERWMKQAAQVDASLPACWSGKPGICSSLWFWLPMQV